MILARRWLAQSTTPQPGAPQPQPGAPPAPPADPQAHPAAATTPTSTDGVRAAVAALVTQERAGTRPRLTGTQVAALVGVKERRAQILLRELRNNHGQPTSGHGHQPTKGGT
jgi:hypothetical protein